MRALRRLWCALVGHRAKDFLVWRHFTWDDRIRGHNKLPTRGVSIGLCRRCGDYVVSPMKGPEA